MQSLIAQEQFVAYGPSHVAVLAVFVVGAVLLVYFGRRATATQARMLGRLLAVLILVVFGAALFYKLIRPDIQTSVPLQLCDIAELVAAYALWTQRHWAFALTYFWGLLLSSQALLTPDIGTAAEGAPDFPHHLFVTFFALHVLVVWAAIFLTWGRGMHPRWNDWRFAVVLTLGWVAFTLAFNALAGTNYGYLNAKPPTASILDPLGPWPLYLVIEIVAVTAAWAAMTWPWERVRRRQMSQA
ncbi:hypothetical protein BVC93_01110 [Mycobacterium sp. MS1601]|uniref:YwaF family protein n=1 Tax=Mycobacterium sp. MS1601 TaxID=1936029 RepID=UPI0009791534|nr:TIGR02206 family membrane protein [Mycobacterium sp. MS1601]AQA01252.1 hypothetical protein BVC93_01110 [Mycobacterium sp. MS1601]